MSDETVGAETYDTREARHILARARAKEFPSERQKSERRAAAADLVKAVVKAAEGADGAEYIASKDSSGNACISAADGATRIVLLARDGVQIVLEGAKVDPVLVSGIEYDPVFKKWVGVDDDRSITPIPGQPIPRRGAAAVVADAIAEMLKSTD